MPEKNKDGLAVEFSFNARQEIKIAFSWYEEKQLGLGERFLAMLERKVKFLSKNPLTYPLKHKFLRIAKINVFPFVIVYEVFEDKVVIYHVFHTRRNPNFWKK